MNELVPTFEERLENHPELRKRFEHILNIAEGKSEGPDTADEVEERTIEALQQLGLEIVEDWAVNKSAQEVASHKNKHPNARAHKKKQPAGTLPSAKQR